MIVVPIKPDKEIDLIIFPFDEEEEEEGEEEEDADAGACEGEGKDDVFEEEDLLYSSNKSLEEKRDKRIEVFE